MRRGVWVVAALVVLAPVPAQAQAAFPGQSGRIAFSSTTEGDSEIYSINPDGSGLLQLTNNTVPDASPSWSPDGQKLVFLSSRGAPTLDTWVMNGDGSGQVLVSRYPSVVPPGNAGGDMIGPSWSPDGQKIVFTIDGHCDGIVNVGSGGVFTMNSDGTGMDWLACGVDDGACCGTAWSPDGTRVLWAEGSAWPVDIYSKTIGGAVANLTDTQLDSEEFNPDWSPSGHKIAYTFSSGPTPSGVYTMNPDGSGKAFLASATDPAWSPDGTKIAVDGVTVMNANGSGSTFVTAGSDPSWQPIPVNSYPRPKGATPFYGSLTIAYEPCTAPDRTHGPPLAYGSCSSPQMTSDYLTVGTADANSHPPRNEGYLRLGVVAGNPATPADEADVTLQFFSDDIFTKAIDDYTGELRAKVALQITDKDNTPNPGGPGAATTTSIPLELTVGCTPVADPLEGSSCTASTSADALAPGTVKEGRRSIWGLGRVEVYDGGADGDAQTPSGDTLFATQGLFVP